MKILRSKRKDQVLVSGLKRGDSQTLEEIYQSYFFPILGFVKNHGGNEEDAKDIFQEGVMVMYRLVQKPDFILTGAFLSLLFPICRNLWYKSVRKQPFYDEVSSMNAGDLVIEDKNILEIIYAREIDHLFKQKLGELGQQCQELLKLFFEGVSMKDIVNKMDLSSVSFAKKKKFQCKEKLVNLVKNDPLFLELKN